MRYAVLDVETSNPKFSSICQIGVAIFERRTYVDGLSILVDPRDYFDTVNVGIHGISEQHVRGAPSFAEAWPQALDYIGDRTIVHHTAFDRSAVQRASALHGISTTGGSAWLDSSRVVRRVWPEFAARGYGLGNLARHFNIEFQHHDALEDARAAGTVLAEALNSSGTYVSDWCNILAQRPTRPSITHAGSSEGILAGEQLVFTGSLSQRRTDWAALVASLGAAVANSVSKKTTIVVVGDQDLARLAGKPKSEKHLKAELLIGQGHGLRIVGEQDLVEMISGNTPPATT